MNKPAEYDVAHPIWLRGREHGIAEERERIIALIEPENMHHIYRHPAGLHMEECIGCKAIALIKGENE